MIKETKEDIMTDLNAIMATRITGKITDENDQNYYIQKDGLIFRLPKTEGDFTIGDDVTITIVEMKGGNVRIGINAPKNMKIYRQEVYDRIVEENREAAHWNMIDLDVISDNLTVRKNKNGKN